MIKNINLNKYSDLSVYNQYQTNCYYCSNLLFSYDSYTNERIPYCTILDFFDVVNIEDSCKHFSSWRPEYELKVTLPWWLRWLE